MSELAEKREVGVKVVREAGQTGLPGIDVRKGDHRGGRTSGAIEKQRELIHEIAQRGFGRRGLPS